MQKSSNLLKQCFICFIVLSCLACASIPPGPILLSEKLGQDLQIVQQAHLNAIDIHFNDIKRNVNSFIDETYSPYIINYVLTKEYLSFQQNQPSLFTTMVHAATEKNKTNTDSVVNDMQAFLSAAKRQIESKRRSLAEPIEEQENIIKQAINTSYSNMVNANNSITVYLQSLQDLKKAQSQALNRIGLTGADTLITQNLSKLSSEINNLVDKGNEIDVKSADAFEKIEEVSSKIKILINKK